MRSYWDQDIPALNETYVYHTYDLVLELNWSNYLGYINKFFLKKTDTHILRTFARICDISPENTSPFSYFSPITGYVLVVRFVGILRIFSA